MDERRGASSLQPENDLAIRRRRKKALLLFCFVECCGGDNCSTGRRCIGARGHRQPADLFEKQPAVHRCWCLERRGMLRVKQPSHHDQRSYCLTCPDCCRRLCRRSNADDDDNKDVAGMERITSAQLEIWPVNDLYNMEIMASGRRGFHGSAPHQ